ncbi:MAG TPA: AAA family ATPase [Candidatus Cybelea sp.]
MFDDVDEAAQKAEAAQKVLEEPPPTMRLKLTPLVDVKIKRTEWLEPGRVPKNTFTLLEGDGDLGKTSFTMGFLAAQTRAERFFPCSDEDAKLYPVEAATVLIIAKEDDHSTLKARLVEQKADVSGITMIDGRELVDASGNVVGGDGTIFLPRDIPLLEEAIRETGATILYIDALHSHVLVAGDSHKPEDVRAAYQQVLDFIARTHITLEATRHWGKSGGPAQNRGLGSSEIGHMARAILSFARHPETPDLYVVAQTKKNLSRAMPTVTYRIDTMVAEDDFGKEWTVPKVVIVGIDESVTADDVALAVPIDGEERGLKETAQLAILGLYVGRDTVPEPEIEKATARQAYRTVVRARGELTKEDVLCRGRDGWKGPVTYTIDRDKATLFATQRRWLPHMYVWQSTGDDGNQRGGDQNRDADNEAPSGVPQAEHSEPKTGKMDEVNQEW